jgi:hypothetical protein
MVPDVQIRRAEVGESKCGDDIPDTEETNLGMRLNDDVCPGLADLPLLNDVTEIERRGGARD